jgi:hypothetical protein
MPFINNLFLACTACKNGHLTEINAEKQQEKIRDSPY